MRAITDDLHDIIVITWINLGNACRVNVMMVSFSFVLISDLYDMCMIVFSVIYTSFTILIIHFHRYCITLLQRCFFSDYFVWMTLTNIKYYIMNLNCRARPENDVYYKLRLLKRDDTYGKIGCLRTIRQLL